VVSSCHAILVCQQSLVCLGQGLWFEGKFSLLVIIIYWFPSACLLLIRMKKNSNDVDIIESIVSENLVSSPLCKHLRFLTHLWLESRFFKHLLFVRNIGQGFLLLQSIQSQKLEMVLDYRVLSFSNKELTILVILTDQHPLGGSFLTLKFN